MGWCQPSTPTASSSTFVHTILHSLIKALAPGINIEAAVCSDTLTAKNVIF